MGRMSIGQQLGMPSNKVSSTKYSPLTFLPLSLLQQVKNVIICFYILNGILQTMPRFRTNNPLSSIIPTIYVILLGVIFELIADLRRWSHDRKINGQMVTAVFKAADQLLTTPSTAADLMVGDIVLLENNANVPADCLVLSTSNVNGQIYINTETLDGERNLKPKRAPSITQGHIEDIPKGESFASINYIDPDKNIYSF